MLTPVLFLLSVNACLSKAGIECRAEGRQLIKNILTQENITRNITILNGSSRLGNTYCNSVPGAQKISFQ